MNRLDSGVQAQGHSKATDDNSDTLSRHSVRVEWGGDSAAQGNKPCLLIL